MSTVDFIGSVIAAISGSIIAYFLEFEFNYMLSVISMCLAFIITLTLKEPPMIDVTESEIIGSKHYLKQAFTIFRSTPLVFIYCLTGAVLGACLIYLDEFWQIILDTIGTPVIYFGIVSALGLVLRIPSNLLAYRLKEKYRYKNIFTIIIILNVIGYTAIFFTRNIYCLIPMVLLFLVSGIIDPLVMGYMHHHTKSDIRATVESLSSLLLRIVSAFVGLVFGYISSKNDIFSGYLYLAIIAFTYLPIQEFVSKKGISSNKNT